MLLVFKEQKQKIWDESVYICTLYIYNNNNIQEREKFFTAECSVRNLGRRTHLTRFSLIYIHIYV